MTAQPDVHSICAPCAERAGGIWPTGHVATIWPGRCDACRRDADLSGVRDWRWPQGRPVASKGGSDG